MRGLRGFYRPFFYIFDFEVKKKERKKQYIKVTEKNLSNLSNLSCEGAKPGCVKLPTEIMGGRWIMRNSAQIRRRGSESRAIQVGGIL